MSPVGLMLVAVAVASVLFAALTLRALVLVAGAAADVMALIVVVVLVHLRKITAHAWNTTLMKSTLKVRNPRAVFMTCIHA